MVGLRPKSLRFIFWFLRNLVAFDDKVGVWEIWLDLAWSWPPLIVTTDHRRWLFSCLKVLNFWISSRLVALSALSVDGPLLKR